MIDRVRYLLGVPIVIAVPLGLLYWIVIHSWARWWRTRGPSQTYLMVLPVLAALVYNRLVRIIVVGGGIGGLTAAIALGKVGIDVQVYERASALREVGAGITLSANALEALDA